VTATRRIELLVFALTLFAFAYFHQGGGWSQNVRFALVRAMVEGETFAIDDFLVYGVRPGSVPGSEALVRHPVVGATFERDGVGWALAWRDRQGRLVPVDATAQSGRRLVFVEDVIVSGDVAYQGGRFHPNKAPGTSFLAVPGYALVCAIERLLGVDVDRWWVLTVNAWLASVLSVGLATAFGAVLLLRLGRSLASERDAVLAALTFAFGTMTWSHATLLFEHNVIATALLAAFYCIECARTVATSGAPRAGSDLGAEGWLVCAGLAAGWAAITNYAMAPLVVVLACFAIARVGWRRAVLWYAAGVGGPLLLVCFYHYACFGTPFTTNYAHQNPMFVAERRLLGVFALPRLDVALTLLFSPFRGLFFTSPVLLAGVAGLVVLLRRRGVGAWGWTIAAIAAFLLLMNASFNGWDGGWVAVPRYLGPAVPFLALPLALAWARWGPITGGLAAASIAIHLLLTAVDPQVPIGDLGLMGAPPRTVWSINPLTRYVLPLFLDGRADPGDPPFPVTAVRGSVSVNPTGIYEAAYYRLFPPGSRVATYNSFNLGELLFPESRWSLLPLLVIGAVGALLLRNAIRTTTSVTGPPRA
jgi:hypothetical protein